MNAQDTLPQTGGSYTRHPDTGDLQPAAREDETPAAPSPAPAKAAAKATAAQPDQE